jgi:hypothetical protein
MPEPPTGALIRAESGTTASGHAKHWKAEIGDDLRDDDPPEVVILCPVCWQREFGDS